MECIEKNVLDDGRVDGMRWKWRRCEDISQREGLAPKCTLSRLEMYRPGGKF
jgi:hypothetical protein